jgi:hypothetical protein
MDADLGEDGGKVNVRNDKSIVATVWARRHAR